VDGGSIIGSGNDPSCHPQNGRYPGGKSLAGVHQWIIGRMCTHAGYVEPFVGSGGILRRKPPALSSIVIDLDDDIMKWWLAQAIPGLRPIHGNGIAWLEDAADRLDYETLVYCDPPYLPSTRVRYPLYRHEMSEAEHVRLLAAVQALDCPCMLSGYPSTLYDDALASWHVESREVITRGGTLRTEVLWCNFPRPTPSLLAMDYGSLGADFRERERVARKIKRWVERLGAMPPRERQALLLALLDQAHRSTLVGHDDGAPSPRPAVRTHGDGRDHAAAGYVASLYDTLS